MLAREYCDAAGIKLKPVILSHHMLYGLKAGQVTCTKGWPGAASAASAEEAQGRMGAGAQEDMALLEEREPLHFVCLNLVSTSFISTLFQPRLLPPRRPLRG